jgi:hypothetical protein
MPTDWEPCPGKTMPRAVSVLSEFVFISINCAIEKTIHRKGAKDARDVNIIILPNPRA